MPPSCPKCHSRPRVFQGQFFTGNENWVRVYWRIMWKMSHPYPSSIRYDYAVLSADVQLLAFMSDALNTKPFLVSGIDAANVHSIFEEHYVAPTLDDAIARTSTRFDMIGMRKQPWRLWLFHMFLKCAEKPRNMNRILAVYCLCLLVYCLCL